MGLGIINSFGKTTVAFTNKFTTAFIPIAIVTLRNSSTSFAGAILIGFYPGAIKRTSPSSKRVLREGLHTDKVVHHVGSEGVTTPQSEHFVPPATP